MSDNNPADRVYNVITSGFGFLNRIREVHPPKGHSAYLAMDCNLMEGVVKAGDHSDVTHVRFNVIVKGKDAQQIIRENFSVDGTVASPREPVVAQVGLGGIFPEIFTHKKGEKAGQPGVALRASLLSIKWLKVGKRIIDLPASGGEPAASSATLEPEAPTALSEQSIREMRRELQEKGSVKLSKDHPEFQQRRAFLSDHSMRWDRRLEAWIRKGRDRQGGLQ